MMGCGSGGSSWFPGSSRTTGSEGGVVGGSLHLWRTTTHRLPHAGTAKKGSTAERNQNRSHLRSTPATLKVCARCGEELLSGFDEGLRVTVDVRPLDERAEFAAVAKGRCTYALLGDGTLAYRDRWRIDGGLVGRGVYAEHVCGRGGVAS